MQHRGPRHGFVLRRYKNITGTICRANGEDSPEEREGCVFIEPHTWPAGFPPFCGRPVLPGSPYCPVHAALCAAPAELPR